nr:hypothetical protein CFP56_34867 [Quercus suber]
MLGRRIRSCLGHQKLLSFAIGDSPHRSAWGCLFEQAEAVACWQRVIRSMRCTAINYDSPCSWSSITHGMIRKAGTSRDIPSRAPSKRSNEAQRQRTLIWSAWSLVEKETRLSRCRAAGMMSWHGCSINAGCLAHALGTYIRSRNVSRSLILSFPQCSTQKSSVDLLDDPHFTAPVVTPITRTAELHLIPTKDGPRQADPRVDDASTSFTFCTSRVVCSYILCRMPMRQS